MSLYIAYIAFICTPHFADGDLAHIRRKLAPLRSNLNFRALVRTPQPAAGCGSGLGTSDSSRVVVRVGSGEVRTTVTIEMMLSKKLSSDLNKETRNYSVQL